MLYNAFTSAAILAVSAFAAAVPVDTTTGNVTADALDFVVNAPLAVTLGSFLSLIDTISSVPDSVVDAGDDAVHNWLRPIGAPAVSAIAAPNALIAARSTEATDAADNTAVAAATDTVNGLVKDVECAAAVAAAVASDLLPAAKILKVKKLIKVLGGVKKVAKLFLEYHDNKSEAIKEGGKTLLELVEVLLGIDSIKKHCK
ncbi:hypothetical protein SCUCBS95973_000394 [Sporothrix curviconia]|uniref:Cell wall galactomannoprotein n=1 Tax=Sporothrix curviconia TaxID=1260050 RepID=A0ABP0APW5_9PEZI